MASDLRDDLAVNEVMLACVIGDLERIADRPELPQTLDAAEALRAIIRDLRPMVGRMAIVLRCLTYEPRIEVEIPIEWEDEP